MHTPFALVLVNVEAKLLVQLSVRDLDGALSLRVERATVSMLRASQLVDRLQELKDERARIVKQPGHRDSQEAVEETVVPLSQDLCCVVLLAW